MAMNEVAFPTLIQTNTSEAAMGGTISAAPTLSCSEMPVQPTGYAGFGAFSSCWLSEIPTKNYFLASYDLILN